MAFRVASFTDKSGESHLNSYWRITHVNIDLANNQGQFDVTGYKDEAARNAALAPIGSRRYFVSGADFGAALAAETAKSQNIREILYAAAAAAKDVVVDNTDPESPVMGSFFDGASQV